MKAIETEYSGVLFRSRLEARWAILFDAMELQWYYEPDCFELKSGKKYTPDFYISEYEVYVEIKPNRDVLSESYHVNRFLEFEKPLLVLMGEYPNFNTNLLFNSSFPLEVILLPKYSKYAPFWSSGQNVGEPESLFFEQFDDLLNKVKQHRFYR